jgi:hypothetical protein
MMTHGMMGDGDQIVMQYAVFPTEFFSERDGLLKGAADSLIGRTGW